MSNTPVKITPDVIFESRTKLGEGPIWDAENEVLYWIDLIGKQLFRGDPSTGVVSTKDLPYRCARITFCESGKMLFSFTRGLAIGTFESDNYQPMASSVLTTERERFNDGACDSLGRFWTGTYDAKLELPIGGIYSFDSSNGVRKVENIRLSNGLRWSPDEKLMYFADSRPGQLWVYEFDLANAELGSRRLLVDYENTGVKPDGCAVDSDGCIWVAEVHRSRVARYTPEGQLDQEVIVPTRRPTSVCFGGGDRKTLYITTRTDGLSEEELKDQPHAGSIFAAKVNTPGLPEHKYLDLNKK